MNRLRSLPLVLIVGLVVLSCAGTPPHLLRRWPMDVEGIELASAMGADHASPEAGWSICGAVFYCCMELKCEDDRRVKSYNYEVCPTRFGQPETRAGAWTVWDGLVGRYLSNKSKTRYPICWRETASCYEHIHPGKVCFNYPN